MGMTPTNILERIERHMPEMIEGQCWIPTYSNRDIGGYVHTKCEAPNHLLAPVHVVVWEAHNAQPKPPGMVIMHSCDNPACCNPEHLVLGTQSDNIRDCVAKGRWNGGIKPK